MKRTVIVLLFVVFFLPVLTMPVLADSGPKPSVNVTFQGLAGTECYATLLADSPDIGPWYVDQPYHEWLADDGISREMFNTFQNYAVEGWYFVGLMFNCTDNGSLNWIYYPPDPFRVLLYIPEEDRWLLSESCERYAFDSYYTATVDKTSNGTVTVTANPTHWASAFLLRLAGTLVVELALAVAFLMRKKKQLVVIGITNVITQIGLNLFLSTSAAASWFGVFFLYPLCEIVVFLLEAEVYTRALREDRFDRKWFTLYAFAANLASFLAGLLIPTMPHIFG